MFSKASVAEMRSRVVIHEQKFEIPPHTYDRIIRKIKFFVEGLSNKGQSHDYYVENRGATKPQDDNSCGKYGEFAAAYYFWRYLGFPNKYPDTEIRYGFAKGWDYDLPFSKEDFEYPDGHVKTCTDKTRGFLRQMNANLVCEEIDKYSWTFQWKNKYGPGGRDKIFDKPNDTALAIFMHVPDMNSTNPVLVATVPCFLLHTHGLFKDPIKPSLVGIKKCVYYKDLVELEKSGDIR